MSLLQQAITFRKAYDQPIEEAMTQPGGFIRMKLLNMQASLIEEETREFLDAVSDFKDKPSDKEHEVHIMKELCDLIFVCYQFAAAYNLDVDTAMDRIFESNMSKLGDDGKPIYRADGKVLKGPNYRPPFLDDLVPLEPQQYDTSSK